MVTDLRDRLACGGDLCPDGLLAKQKPLSDPPHHDEMRFIVQHQVSALWMNLLIHEHPAAIGHMHRDELGPRFKILTREKPVQR